MQATFKSENKFLLLRVHHKIKYSYMPAGIADSFCSIPVEIPRQSIHKGTLEPSIPMPPDYWLHTALVCRLYRTLTGASVNK